MSMKEIAEGLVQGATWGLSNLIGVTGKGGLVHDDDTDEVAIFHEDNLELLESGVTIPWAAISHINNNDESEYVEINHIGGLRIKIPYGRFVFDGDVGEIIDSQLSQTSDIKTLLSLDDAELENSEEKIEKIEEALGMIEESRRIYEMVNDSSKVVVLEEFAALSGFYKFVLDLRNLYWSTDSSEDDDVLAFHIELEEWIKDNREKIDNLDEIADFWRNNIVDVEDLYSEDVRSDAAAMYADIKYRLRYDLREGESPDEFGYALGHSFFPEGEMPDEQMWIEWFDDVFASPDNEKNRKVIVCTSESRNLARTGECESGVSVVRACDLEKLLEYQDRDDPLDTVQGQREASRERGKEMPMLKAKASAREYAESRKARRLVFEEGHPRDGVTYIQHPLRTNTYIDIESFHASLLERKYNELIGILTELGAKEITCSVENSGSKDAKRRQKRSGHLEAGKGCVGNIEGDASSESDSTKFLSLYKKLDTHLELRPVGERRLPDDLIFYPFEDGWQRLAKEVLAGRLLRASFDLTYRKDYAVTGKYVKTLSAKIESLIPGYDFNVGGNYESEFEEELKELESTTWHYEVDFGEAETGDSDTQVTEKSVEVEKASAPASAASNDKAEAMILGRAKRYAKTEEATKSGMLTDAQRADLEKLAAKYGIDEFRLEELIDEAFA